MRARNVSRCLLRGACVRACVVAEGNAWNECKVCAVDGCRIGRSWCL